MPNRKYYVLCSSNCKYESMTKEQILAAITQAVESGEIHDVDTGFVTTVREQNHGAGLSFWIGTTAEYNAIERKAENCFYICTDDTTGDDLKKSIEELKTEVEALSKIKITPVYIVVTVQGGTAICTNEDGEEMTYIRDENVFKFIVNNYGKYTITATNGTFTKTETVNVDTIKVYEKTINYYDPTFANNTWDAIVDVVKRGVIPAEWNAGDTKDGIRIIGKNHDEYEDGKLAPFTFMWCPRGKADLDTNYNFGAGDWTQTTFYKENLATYVSELPEALRGALQKVKKPVYYNGEITTRYEEAFLLSASEFTGNTEYAHRGEGTQYEYYRNGNRVTSVAWTRSWDKDANWRFTHVDSNGGLLDCPVTELKEILVGICI